MSMRVGILRHYKIREKASTSERPKVKYCHNQAIRGVLRPNEPSADMKVSIKYQTIEFQQTSLERECRLNSTVSTHLDAAVLAAGVQCDSDQ